MQYKRHTIACENRSGPAAGREASGAHRRITRVAVRTDQHHHCACGVREGRGRGRIGRRARRREQTQRGRWVKEFWITTFTLIFVSLTQEAG